jgi:hypothetical protein
MQVRLGDHHLGMRRLERCYAIECGLLWVSSNIQTCIVHASNCWWREGIPIQKHLLPPLDAEETYFRLVAPQSQSSPE